MYIIEYRLEQSRRCQSPLSCDQVTNEHCFLGSFETFKEGCDYLRRYYDGHHRGMDKEDYNEEFFDCKEFAHHPDNCEARTWKSWEAKQGENDILTSYEELYLHTNMRFKGKDPFEDIVDYHIG